MNRHFQSQTVRLPEGKMFMISMHKGKRVGFHYPILAHFKHLACSLVLTKARGSNQAQALCVRENCEDIPSLRLLLVQSIYVMMGLSTGLWIMIDRVHCFHL